MGFPWKIEIFRGVGSKIAGFGVLWSKIEILVEKWWFLLKNRVLMGFWSRNREKVEKSREFGHFLKIGENREK